jgi:hypothetical protein
MRIGNRLVALSVSALLFTCVENLNVLAANECITEPKLSGKGRWYYHLDPVSSDTNVGICHLLAPSWTGRRGEILRWAREAVPSQCPGSPMGSTTGTRKATQESLPSSASPRSKARPQDACHFASSSGSVSNAACFDPSPTLKMPSTASSPRPMPPLNPSCGPHAQTASSPLSKEGRKS